MNGTGFDSTTTVQVGGAADASTYVSATEVTATVSASQLASGGMLSVIALNGTESSGSGPAVNLQVTNPAPTITQVSPATVTTVATNPTIAVIGTGFVPTTVIQVKMGGARTTVFVSATQVNATLSAADLAATGSLSLTAVQRAAPGSGTSTAATVAVNNPAPGPAIKVSPALVFAGTTSPTTVTVTGTNFLPTSTVEVGLGPESVLVSSSFTGTPRATTYVSSTRNSHFCSRWPTKRHRSNFVAVVNPTPGGGNTLSRNNSNRCANALSGRSHKYLQFSFTPEVTANDDLGLWFPTSTRNPV